MVASCFNLVQKNGFHKDVTQTIRMPKVIQINHCSITQSTAANLCSLKWCHCLLSLITMPECQTKRQETYMIFSFCW